jgi:hypothetical protein
MQNKSFTWIFVILLTLAVAYQLSFGLVASSFEKKIHQLAVDSIASTELQGASADSAILALERKMLRDSSEAKAYPLVGHSYSYLKSNQLALGLDLRGGMSVTLEVSIPDMILAISDYNQNPAFLKAIEEAREAQKSSSDDYLTLFEKSWKNQNSGVELWRIFNNLENQEKFPAKTSDADVIKILRKEAEDAISNTENIIRKRIDQFGVTQPNVQKQSFSGRILVELPGVDDRERVRKNLKSTANLEFWDTYFNTEVTYKYMPSNLAASLGYAQFLRLEELVNLKRMIWKKYSELFKPFEFVNLNPEPNDVINSVWSTVLVTNNNSKLTRDVMMREFDKRNIPTRPFFYPLSKLPAFRDKVKQEINNQPISLQLSEHGICLPSALNLTEENIERVVEVFGEFADKY